MSFSVDYLVQNVLKEHQRKRILVTLKMLEDPKGIEYNVIQSKIAIGSGGLWGKGFLQGSQTKGDFVPEQSTDFIFCTIGEEFGLVGSWTLVLLYTLLIVRIFFTAERQKTRFGRVYGYGVGSILFMHFMVNIGMAIDLMPVIGIPLPFISYGGSSLFAFTILLFLLIRLDANRENELDSMGQ
jgi:rod shape determining protein RodA